MLSFSSLILTVGTPHAVTRTSHSLAQSVVRGKISSTSINGQQRRWFLQKVGLNVGMKVIQKLKHNPLQQAVSSAERIVGHPAPFLNIQKILNDEVGAIAYQFGKLLKSHHPLVKTSRDILFDMNPQSQVRGLIILLLARALSHGNNVIDDIALQEILAKQKILAEVTELIHTGFLIHRGLVDLGNSSSDPLSSVMKLGNKMAVLCGDFLHANASVALSDLKNSSVHALIATAIADMSQGFFSLPESGELSSLNGNTSHIPTTMAQWKDAIYLSHGSLLSQACKSAALLSGEGSQYGETCAKYGKHVMLAHQARCDIQRLKHDASASECIHLSHSSSELCSLPVAIMAENHGGIKWILSFLRKDPSQHNKTHILKHELIDEIISDPYAVELSEKTCSYHSNKAVECIEQLADNEAGKTLISLTNALASKT